jgi:hypothetical protein
MTLIKKTFVSNSTVCINLVICYLVDKFECETILPSPPMAIPKTDVTVKLELGVKEQQQQPRLLTIENKENIIDGNPLPISSRSAAMPVIPCRPKNDVRSSNI